MRRCLLNLWNQLRPRKLPLMSPTLIFLLEFFCVVTSWPIQTNLQQESHHCSIVLSIIIVVVKSPLSVGISCSIPSPPFIFQKLLHVHWNEYRFSPPPPYLTVESFCETFLKLKWHITLGLVLLRDAQSKSR